MTARAHADGPSPVEENLPPLPSPDADDDERARAVMARMVARFGAPSLEDYRRTYRSAGVDWPGDDAVRARHPVADDPATFSPAPGPAA